MSDNFVALKYKHNPLKSFSVDWYIGKRCNYSCSYCADYLHDNFSKHVSYKRMKLVVDKLYNRYGTNILFSLTGGEPTINPDFIKLCKYMKKDLQIYDCSLTTNGARNKDYFLKLYEFLDNITISFHFEWMHDKVDEFVEKVLALEDYRRQWNKQKGLDWRSHFKKKTLVVRFMVYPGMLEKIDYMNKIFEDYGLEKIEYRYIRPQPKTWLEVAKQKEGIKWKFKNKPSPTEVDHVKTFPTQEELKNVSYEELKQREDEFYNDEEKKYLRNVYKKKNQKLLLGYFEENGQIVEKELHYNSLNFARQNNFKGWMCWAGLNSVKITPDGTVFVGSCHFMGPLGNIFQEDFVLPTEPVICQKLRCTDNLDLRNPKIKDPKYKYLVEDKIIQ